MSQDDPYSIDEFLHNIGRQMETGGIGGEFEITHLSMDWLQSFFTPPVQQRAAMPPCPDPLHLLVNRQGTVQSMWSTMPASTTLASVRAIALHMLDLIEDYEVRYRLMGVRIKAGPPKGHDVTPYGTIVPVYEQELVELPQNAEATLRAAYTIVGAPGADGVPRHALPLVDPHPDKTHLWLMLMRDRSLRVRIDDAEIVGDPARLIYERMQLERTGALSTRPSLLFGG